MEINLSLPGEHSVAMILEQRWLHKIVRYDQGRTGMVVDLARDGSKLAIRREHIRGVTDENELVWRAPHEVEILDVKRRSG